MTTTIQMIDGEAVLLFDEDMLKSLDLMEGDTLRVEPLEGGGMKLTPIRNSPIREAPQSHPL